MTELLNQSETAPTPPEYKLSKMIVCEHRFDDEDSKDFLNKLGFTIKNNNNQNKSSYYLVNLPKGWQVEQKTSTDQPQEIRFYFKNPQGELVFQQKIVNSSCLTLTPSKL